MWLRLDSARAHTHTHRVSALTVKGYVRGTGSEGILIVCSSPIKFLGECRRMQSLEQGPLVCKNSCVVHGSRSYSLFPINTSD